ncbi:MAG: hypothetical protein ACE5ID_01325 [Acidobacteriota bacterium]
MTAVSMEGSEDFFRLPLPARFSFGGRTFQCSELAVELDPLGVRLATQMDLAVGSSGSVTLVSSRWDDPFTLQGEIAEIKKQDGSPEAEILIRFLDPGQMDRTRLERLATGRAGSVPEAIRRSAREAGRSLLQELHRRPVNQKVMFALQARRREFEAVIKDGNPTVLLRLMENPRLERKDIVAILKDPRTPPRLLAAVAQDNRFKGDEEIRASLCAHPLMPMEGALSLLGTLSAARLKMLAENRSLRPALRQKAKQKAGLR